MKRLGTVLGGIAVACCIAAGVAIAGPPITCTGGPCNGTAAAEEVIGTPEADQIRAFNGADYLDGNGGDDVLRGGGGADRSDGDAGDDRHVGGPGSDHLSESGGPSLGGQDVLNGGNGGDFGEGGARGDTLLGGTGNDRAAESSAALQARGLSSCYRGFCAQLFGDRGSDTIRGGVGKDYLEGEEGFDVHDGGPGDDVIDAANEDTGARDRVICGGGDDIVFARPNDRVANSCERVKRPL